MQAETDRLHHLTLDTGDLSTPLLASVDPAALRITEVWLRMAASSQAKVPLPGDGLSAYAAKSLHNGGVLVQTLYGFDGAPMVTFGVAPHGGTDAEIVWSALSAKYPGATMPLYPWCIVQLHTSLLLHHDALRWIGDYERCVALAWIRIVESDDADDR